MEFSKAQRIPRSMKILVIVNYWAPWNNSGTFRWTHLGEYLDFDVLTYKKPTRSFYDNTIPEKTKKVYRFNFICLPAFLSGMLLSVSSWFIRRDIYIYSSPPETLIIGAWISQLFGRKTVLDLRDKISRPDKRSIFVPVYKFFYRRIRNKVKTMEHFGDGVLIRHGYKIENTISSKLKGRFLTNKRYSYLEYLRLLSLGIGVDFSNNPTKHYTSSSVVSFRHLESEIKGKELLHPELFEFKPESWERIAGRYKVYLKNI